MFDEEPGRDAHEQCRFEIYQLRARAENAESERNSVVFLYDELSEKYSQLRARNVELEKAYDAILDDCRIQEKRITELEAELEKIANVIGSPKDVKRLPEALKCVLLSYRNRTEKAEAEVARLRKASMEAVSILQSVNRAEGTIPFKAMQALEASDET